MISSAGSKTRAEHQSLNFGTRFVELLTLTALAIGAPLFGVLADGPEFFVNVRASRSDLLIVTLLVAFLLPSVLILSEQLIGFLSRRLADVLHHVFTLVLLLGFFVPQLTRHFAVSGIVALMIALCLAIAFACGRKQFPALGKLLIMLSPLTVIAPLFFLLSPGVYSLLFPKARLAYVHGAAEKPTTPVVMVVFDEFPLNVLLNKELKIDPLRFPNIAAFSNQSYWFKNATSINQFTPLAVPALLAGRFPASSRQLPTVESYPINLFTALASSHEMQVYEPFTRLCPPELCPRKNEVQPRTQRFTAMTADIWAILLNVIVPGDLGIKVPDIDGKWGNFWDEDEQEWEPPDFSRDARVREFRNYIASIKASSKPALYFAHIILPHMPYQFLPSGRGYKKSGPRAYDDNRWIDDPALIRVAYQQFLQQTGAADALFGTLISKLKEMGIFDQALIVLAADHGVSFQIGTYRRGHPQHASFYEDILNVPLFIKLPFQNEGSVDYRNAETIDILPSILDVLHLSALPNAEGQSVFGPIEKARTQKKYLVGRIPEGKVHSSDSAAEWGKDLAGQTVSFDMPRDFPHATLDWKFALPGYSNPSTVNPYFLGPHSELLGRALSSFSLIKANTGRIKFFDHRGPTDKQGVANFKKNSSQCPCSFSGSIEGEGITEGTEIAVSVNGVMQAFGNVMLSREKGELHFSMFVSDAAFTEGENKVEFFVVRSAASGLELLPLRIE